MGVCARHFFQFCFDVSEFIGQHRLEQFDLPRKMGVKRLLADAQFLCQVVHGHTAESVTEKMRPRRIDNSLRVGIKLATSCSGFGRRFHPDNLITMRKLIQYI